MAAEGACPGDEIKEEPELQVAQPQTLGLPHQRSDVDPDEVIDVQAADRERRPRQQRSRVEIPGAQARDGKRHQIQERRHGRGERDAVHEDLDVRGNDDGVQRNHAAAGRPVEREVQECPEFGPRGIGSVLNGSRGIGLRDEDRVGSGDPDVSIGRRVAQLGADALRARSATTGGYRSRPVRAAERASV